GSCLVLVSEGLRLSKIQGAFVNAATQNHTFDAFVLYGTQVFNVFQVGDTAGGDDGNLHVLGQLDGGFDVYTSQHAVAANIGVDNGLAAVVFKFLGQIQYVVAGQLAPAVGGDFAVTGIQANNDVARKGAAGVLQETRAFDSGSANNDIAHASVQVALDGIQVADTTADLYGNFTVDGSNNGFDGFAVLGLTGKSAVQVHQMQAPGPLFQPLCCYFGRRS